MITERFEITAEYVRSILHYDIKTGVFTWRERPKSRFSGKAAGSRDDKGYVVIRIDNRNYKAHRLAWFYMTGCWPSHSIDHRDLNKGNNAWDNLRCASNMQNSANRQAYRNGTSGYKGVSWAGWANKWRASIRVNGRLISLGYFDSGNDAASAYLIAAEKYFGEFARAA